jgi:hypothetical protein
MTQIQIADDVPTPPQQVHTKGQFGNLTPDEKSAFDAFKEQCTAEGLLVTSTPENGDDLSTGICDDGTLL